MKPCARIPMHMLMPLFQRFFPLWEMRWNMEPHRNKKLQTQRPSLASCDGIGRRICSANTQS